MASSARRDSSHSPTRGFFISFSALSTSYMSGKLPGFVRFLHVSHYHSCDIWGSDQYAWPSIKHAPFQVTDLLARHCLAYIPIGYKRTVTLRSTLLHVMAATFWVFQHYTGKELVQDQDLQVLSLVNGRKPDQFYATEDVFY